MKLYTKLLIVSLLYFAEGFPFGIVEQTLQIYFFRHGWGVVNLGLLSLLKLPYALKFLWAPAVDFIGARRQWIASAQFLMAGSLLLLISLDPASPNVLLWTAIAALAVLSATQDIAVDAYTIELLKPSELGIANGFRQAAYRVAMLVAGGVFMYLVGWIGWKESFFLAALILVGCSVVALKLPRVEVERPPVSLSSIVAPVKDLLSRPGVVQVALFILLYKLGDLALGPMVGPFWGASGLLDEEIGFIRTYLGVPAAIAGGLAGGLFIMRFGIFHGLWFLGLWQALSNLSYAWVAAYPSTGHLGIYAASAVESFCGGLGTSAFLAFLMSICRKEFSATQYAVLSALFQITGTIVGSFSGLAVLKMGYSDYFALTFVLSLPALAFIFVARSWIPRDPNGTK